MPTFRRPPGVPRRRRLRRGRALVTALLILGLGVPLGAGISYLLLQPAVQQRAAETGRENAALRAELERAKLELGMEKATREELERQLANLNAQLKALETELEFFRSRRPAR